MQNEDEGKDRNEEDKENLEDSRAETSMSDSTFVPTSGRVENKEAIVNSDGLLDLSHLSLTNLARNFREEYAKVRHLDVRGNVFQTFAYTKMFEKCEILDARDCQINRFAADFNEHLRELYLAGNQLKQAAQLSRFENLTILDLSANQIEEHIVLSLKKLETLNLSSNFLSQLPDLNKCSLLRSLDLSDNRINDLSNVPKLVCPDNLTHLAVSSNLIDDLSQFSLLSFFKKLTSVYIAGNPCIEDVIKNETFEYKSYIVACCSENLEFIDQAEIEDHVRTEGEWLAIQGGIRKIGPGGHRVLCEQLSSHFPKNDEGPPTPAQKSCYKALEKRRKSSSQQTADSDRTVNSVYSPFREWNGKLEKQYNLNRSLGMDEMMTPVKRNSRQTGDQNIRMCSPPEARKNRSFTFRNSPCEETLEVPYPRPLNYSRTNSTDTVILSSRTDTCLLGDDRSEITPLPVIETPVTPTKNETDTSKSRSVSVANRRSPSVADVSIVVDHQENLAERVCHLERKVAELGRQNENLTTINNQLAEMLEKFEKDRLKMWEMIRGSIPKPENMSSSLFAEAEDGLQTHIVRWEMPLVKGFEIHVDGNRCGRVVGKNNSARITDLDATKSHCVQIQAIGLSGLKGEMSAKLNINGE